MARKNDVERLNIIGASANPKVLQAISKAAKSRSEIVQRVEVVADLNELTSALERVDGSLSTLVFLDRQPDPDPDLVQAVKQIHSRAADDMIIFISKNYVERLPDEFRGPGMVGTMPRSEVSLFQRFIDSASIPLL